MKNPKLRKYRLKSEKFGTIELIYRKMEGYGNFKKFKFELAIPQNDDFHGLEHYLFWAEVNPLRARISEKNDQRARIYHLKNKALKK